MMSKIQLAAAVAAKNLPEIKPMTEPTDNEALVEELARKVHGALSRADVMRYLDMPSDTADQVALAILPIITRRDAETWNRAIEAAEKKCLKLGFSYTAKTIASLKDHSQ